jgi:flagella basal body P-ring formation protein FlgA
MRSTLILFLAAAGILLASDSTAVERSPLTAERILPAMQRALGDTAAQIEIVGFSTFPAPEGEIEFSLKDLNPPSSATAPTRWRGYVHEANERIFAIWAIVRIKAECTRVIATQNLPVGRPILADQVREEKYQSFPFGKYASVKLVDIVGRAPLRTLHMGTTVSPDVTNEPIIIANGADIVAEFHSGRLHISAPAVALGSGRMGEMISVRNRASKKIFVARIQSSDHVVVEVGQ